MDKTTLCLQLRQALEKWEALEDSRGREREALRRKIQTLCDELDKLEEAGL